MYSSYMNAFKHRWIIMMSRERAYKATEICMINQLARSPPTC